MNTAIQYISCLHIFLSNFIYTICFSVAFNFHYWFIILTTKTCTNWYAHTLFRPTQTRRLALSSVAISLRRNAMLCGRSTRQKDGPQSNPNSSLCIEPRRGRKMRVRWKFFAIFVFMLCACSIFWRFQILILIPTCVSWNNFENEHRFRYILYPFFSSNRYKQSAIRSLI